jgi:hypothetical protein
MRKLTTLVLLSFGLLITGIFMNELLDPVDQEFTNKFKAMAQSVEDNNLTVQPAFQDWLVTNISEISYYSDNVFVTTTPGKYNIGDKIRLTQGGSTKYFYITEFITSTRIRLNAGDDYTYIIDSLDSFFYSRVVNPSGFPLVFNFTPRIYKSTTNISASFTSRICTFALNGGLATMSYSLVADSMPASTSLINIESPFSNYSGLFSGVFFTGLENQSQHGMFYDFGDNGDGLYGTLGFLANDLAGDYPTASWIAFVVTAPVVEY